MRKRLETSGATLQRANFKSPSGLSAIGPRRPHQCDWNWLGPFDRREGPKRSTSFGPNDSLRSNFDKTWITRNVDVYTYALRRVDGTSILGDIKEIDKLNTSPEDDHRQNIFAGLTTISQKDFRLTN
ncbi:hypothetical protein BDZ45DRAFT_672947 [Acephala macrosclerotiorum]|nr:hypothetical protein BDZ45DRAFT_672947 [Acephala macrosclerotiorum]